MIEALFNDPTYLGAKRMLDATVACHQAIAANIANAETPNYKRIDLAPSFRQELQKALASGDPNQLRGLQPTLAVDSQALPTKPDGNTVNLERELVELGENTLQDAVETKVISESLYKLRMAITGKY